MLVLWSVLLLGRAGAVTFLETGDVGHNTTTPGDNSGWQYEGKFNAFLGVPIGPLHFITAGHIGGTIGDVLDFHGDAYVTVGFQNIGTTDLRIWEVDGSKPFPTYAPLSSGVADVGGTVTVIGRGTQRGAAVTVGSELKGWQWGTSDFVQRWGKNVVSTVASGGVLGQFLQCDFDRPGVAEECHLSTGDSGGGLFVLEAGLWRLAGISYGVDGPFREPPAGTASHGMLFDVGGLEYLNGSSWILVPEGPADVASSFYCSRISAHLPQILGITGGDGSLPGESYGAWQKLYFTPTEIANPALTAPLADADGDGVENVLEFALNLEPGYSARVMMEPDSGLHGLPLVRIETISGEERVTVEYVRRTTASDAGLSYVIEFSPDLEDWQDVGTETAVAINARWERVKRVDAQTIAEDSRRFARLRVVLEE
jgi:hypothetical protein